MTTKTRYPQAIYAVAGAGDLAYRQLLNSLPKVAGIPARFDALRAELPGRVERLRAELPGRVEQLRSEVPVRVAQLPGRVDQLRAEVPAAVNSAVNSLVADAVQVYGDLVARGTQVVDGRESAPKSTTAPKAATKAAPRKTTAKKVAKKASPAAKTGPAKATKAVKKTAPKKA